jgi:hypothetical protein
MIKHKSNSFQNIWLCVFFIALWLYIFFIEVFVVPSYWQLKSVTGEVIGPLVAVVLKVVEPVFWTSVASLLAFAILRWRMLGELPWHWVRIYFSLLFQTSRNLPKNP